MSQTMTAVELTTNASTPKSDARQSRLPARPDDPITPATTPRKGPTAAIFLSIGGVTLISSMLAGVVTVALPHMVTDLHIPASLLLWPSSIYALTCGCSLILAGAIADVVGSRFMYILGTALQSAFTLACGLSRTSTQLILFRGLAGVAVAFCLPSAVSLITSYFPHGRRRNMAFATMGGGQPLGFAVGLVVGGVLADSPATWRGAFYIAAGINTLVLIVTFFGLPKLAKDQEFAWKQLWNEIDWTGAILLSTSLGMLSYVFAALTGAVLTIREPTTISLVVLAILLIPAFALWVQRQERLGRPAIIPNSIWRNRVFTSICIDVFLLWGAFNSMEALLTFFFQDVQFLSATQSSIRFLPLPVAGVVVNGFIGAVIHRLRANWAIVLGVLVSAISPILTAIMKPSDPYWEYVFPAITLSAVGCDVLFTASNLVVTNAFPDKTQALAGGVFNTVAQIGKSVGLAISAIIANTITTSLEDSGKPRAQVLLEGYRGAWWFCFGSSVAVLLISIAGLRNIGKLGVKRD